MNKPLRNRFSLSLLTLCCSFGANAFVEPSNIIPAQAPSIEHCDDLLANPVEGAFMDMFLCGDELFELRFNAADGAGMDVGDGGRFTRVPRADLNNWRGVEPMRTTGPNGEACNVCHLAETIGGAGDGGGPAALNVIRDPNHLRLPQFFIQRNTPHLFGMAGLQLLAEEMTAKLHKTLAQTQEQACQSDTQRSADLKAKGVAFGSVVVTPRFAQQGLETCLAHATVSYDLEGIDDDLVVKPFQWKGSELNVRNFSRDAFHNELGMTPTEMAGDGVDNDFDGVADEITIADVTAMTIYLAAQPRPTTLVELNELRTELLSHGAEGAALVEEWGLPELSSAELDDIRIGERRFKQIGCADCHKPSMKVKQTVFNEPSSHAAYRDAVFPAGQQGLDPLNPISFDITADLPDNQIHVGAAHVADLGNFDTDNKGRAIVRLYGDLKRHDMGPGLAENIDETGSGASVWLTKELWGLANTAPYLHDGRATTVEEAIAEHGGEAAGSRSGFANLSEADQAKVLAFLNNLVLFFPSEEEEE